MQRGIKLHMKFCYGFVSGQSFSINCISHISAELKYVAENYRSRLVNLCLALPCVPARINIRGSDLSSGQELVPYLPPVPPRGVGYQRMVFVLYNQADLIEDKEADQYRVKDAL